MPVSLEQWVKDLGLDEAAQKTVLTAMGGDVKKKAEEYLLRQEDYSKNMNELAAKKTALDAEYEKKNADVEKFSTDVANWKAGAEKKLADAIAARDAVEGRLNNLAAKAKKIAEENGIPETEIEEILKAAPAKREPNPDPNDKKKYVTEEEFMEAANAAVRIPAVVQKIFVQHRKLFGEEAAEAIDFDKMILEAKKSGRTLQGQWEEQFKVETRRKELADAEVQKRIDAAVKEAETRTRSEILAANPNLANQGGGRKDLPGSPVLTIAREHAKGAKPDETAVNARRGVSAAIAAFNEGKHATPDSAAVKGA